MPPPPAADSGAAIMAIADHLSARVQSLSFERPVTHVYNPLDYAREVLCDYVHRYGRPPKLALLLGMNPGPFGMAQTGVPFGEVAAVRDWLGLQGRIGKPATEHPDRPVEGFACRRSEVSGARLWGFLRQEFGQPEAFFERAFVWNYCPLLFCRIERSGGRDICRNLTPDALAADQTRALYAACDEALIALVEVLGPRYLVGVGGFAHQRLQRLFADSGRHRIGRMLHPSPANPQANRDFAGSARRQLTQLGLWPLLKPG